jgi:hypothetical protein
MSDPRDRRGAGPAPPADLSEADRVWNRAAMDHGGAQPRRGDQALADVLKVHGDVMNGGMMHALECCALEELERAAAGFRYFGMEEAALAIEWAVQRSEHPASAHDAEAADRFEREANSRYRSAAFDDSVLYDRFDRAFRDQRSAFAPLDS